MAPGIATPPNAANAGNARTWTRQLSFKGFAFDLESDKQEKDGHQAVVDDQEHVLVQLETTELDLDGYIEEVLVPSCETGNVGKQQSRSAGGQKENAARRLKLQEPSNRI